MRQHAQWLICFVAIFAKASLLLGEQDQRDVIATIEASKGIIFPGEPIHVRVMISCPEHVIPQNIYERNCKMAPVFDYLKDFSISIGNDYSENMSVFTKTYNASPQFHDNNIVLFLPLIVNPAGHLWFKDKQRLRLTVTTKGKSVAQTTITVVDNDDADIVVDFWNNNRFVAYYLCIDKYLMETCYFYANDKETYISEYIKYYEATFALNEALKMRLSNYSDAERKTNAINDALLMFESIDCETLDAFWVEKAYVWKVLGYIHLNEKDKAIAALGEMDKSPFIYGASLRRRKGLYKELEKVMEK